MNYQIIKDEEKLDQFVAWLPELGPSECYFLSLFARKKYAPEIKLRSGHQNLRRIICNEKDLIKSKVKQLEIPLGHFEDNGNPIPQHALALYITPNPRCHIKASKSLVKLLVDKVTQDYSNYNPVNLAQTEVHRAKSTTRFVEFDFDCPEGDSVEKFVTDKIAETAEKVNIDACTLIRTRGGLHVLVEPEKVIDPFRQTFFKDIVDLGVDQKGDNMIPVVGCTQGDFVPHFIRPI